jgi:mycothione reductase
VRLSATITGVHRRDGGGVTVALDDGSTVAGDLLLVAAGRQPNTDDLGL